MGDKPSRTHSLARFGLVFVALAIAFSLNGFCSAEEPEVETAAGPTFDDLLAEDPWGVADQQRLFAIEAWKDGNAFAAVSHAHAATQAAFRTVPETATKHRYERDDDPLDSQFDVWERSLHSATAAYSTMAAAALMAETEPDDHVGNYDRSHFAWTDVREAQRLAISAWDFTEAHLDDSTNRSAADEWRRSTSAWEDAAFAWDHARAAVNDYNNAMIETWWNSDS